nr:glutamate receptor ionotropic, delta-2-like isoform X1 [Parasteatoda tepidariorum]
MSLTNPCFYRWIFLDTHPDDLQLLKYVNASTVCWRAFYVTRQGDLSNNNSKLAIHGSDMNEKGSCILKDKVAEWSSASGLKVIHLADRRIRNFKGITLRTTFVNEKPFYFISEEGKPEGIEYQLIKTLREKLNFKIDIIKRRDQDTGRELPNGSWTGYIGLVQRGDVIFTVATISMRATRIKVMDYSSPYIFNKLSFVVLNPALESRQFVLIRPMTPTVWASIFVALILGSAALYALTHFLPTKHIVQDSYNFWYLLSTFGNEGM